MLYHSRSYKNKEVMKITDVNNFFLNTPQTNNKTKNLFSRKTNKLQEETWQKFWAPQAHN